MVKVDYDHVHFFFFNKTFFEEVGFSSASQHVHSSEDCLFFNRVLHGASVGFQFDSGYHGSFKSSLSLFCTAAVFCPWTQVEQSMILILLCLTEQKIKTRHIL